MDGRQLGPIRGLHSFLNHGNVLISIINVRGWPLVTLNSGCLHLKVFMWLDFLANLDFNVPHLALPDISLHIFIVKGDVVRVSICEGGFLPW